MAPLDLLVLNGEQTRVDHQRCRRCSEPVEHADDQLLRVGAILLISEAFEVGHPPEGPAPMPIVIEPNHEQYAGNYKKYDRGDQE
jgi:hypothetical protein